MRRMIRVAVLACAALCPPLAAADKGLEQAATGAQKTADATQESTTKAKWNGPKFPDRIYLVNERHEAPPPKQVEAEKPIASLFPGADTITLAIAFVPDPRVPRHRRAFDIAVSSITSGMQDADYVIDRFAFPWSYKSAAGSSDSNGDSDSGDNSSNDDTTTQVIDDGKFGLMLFRQDCWRKPGADCPHSTERVTAMYLVPETVTFGVATKTLEHALACVREQLSDSQSIPASGANTRVSMCIAEPAKGSQSTTAQAVPTNPESTIAPAAPAKPSGPKPRVAFLNSSHSGCKRMVLLGPSFSGSIDSIARVLSATLPEAGKSPDGKEVPGDEALLATGVCTISMSATAESNQLIVGYGKPLSSAPASGKPTPIYAAKYYSLAVPDDVKLEALADLADHLGVDAKKKTGDEDRAGKANQAASDAKGGSDQLGGSKQKEMDDDASMALLCEESSFGSGLCDATESNSAKVRNLKFIKMRFPANIADIRYHRSQAQRQAASDTPVDVSALNGTLHLDEGAENGSEYPDNQQSPLTAASSELKLDAMLAILGKKPPGIIAVAATDVRDRLFLFDLLRAAVPSALLVDMEADVLLAHPDFLHASRGVVMLASHQLHDDRRSVGDDPVRSYATDYEALAIAAISQLMHGKDPLSSSTDRPPPCVFVAARGGPRRATIWRNEGEALPDCITTNQVEWNWYQLQRWSGIIGVLLALALAAWLARRCDSWITHKWAGWEAPIEFAALPLIAAAMVLLSLPQSTKSWQGLRNVLVVCAVLSPLLALHRAASRTFTASALENGKWFFSLRKLGRAVHKLPPTIKATLLPAAIVNVVFIILALCTWIGASLPGHSDMSHYWLRLAMDTSSGLALLPALGITLSAAFFGLFFICVSVCRHVRNTAIMELVAAKLSLHIVHREFSKALLLGMYIALAFVVAKSLPLALTIFGPFASYATCSAEVALGCQAIMFIAWALQSSRRLHSLAATLDWTVQRTHGTLEADKIWKEFWSACPNGPVFLPNTPFSASLQPVIETYQSLNGGATKALASRILSDAKEQSGQIVGWIKEPCGDKPAVGIWAIYRLLVSEVNALRWSVFGALFSCLTLVLVVYAFPAPGADNFLLLGLALMILAGLITAYAVTSLERSKCISRVLCNTSEKVEFSWTYFAYLVSPALLLALAVAILEMPGVLVWGNGLMAMLKYIGLFK
jgi:hypothetical protein